MPLKKTEDERVNKLGTGLVRRTAVPPTQKAEQSIFPRHLDPIHLIVKKDAASTTLSSLTSSSMVSSRSSSPLCMPALALDTPDNMSTVVNLSNSFSLSDLSAQDSLQTNPFVFFPLTIQSRLEVRFPWPEQHMREIDAIQQEGHTSVRHTPQPPVSSSKINFLKQLSNKRGNSAETKEDIARPAISGHFAGSPIALIKNRRPPPLNLVSISAAAAPSQNTPEPEAPLAPRKITFPFFPLLKEQRSMHSTSDNEQFGLGR